MSNRKTAASKTDKSKRTTVPRNILSILSQPQIQEFKEAFAIIDHNNDGTIDISDLKRTYESLGFTPDEIRLKEMLNEAKSPINLPVFLSLFGDKMAGADSDQSVIKSFRMFDKDGSGHIHEEYLKDILKNMGDNLSDKELKEMWKDVRLNDDNQFDYVAYTNYIKKGEDENN